jgi:hypothetical protein
VLLRAASSRGGDAWQARFEDIHLGQLGGVQIAQVALDRDGARRPGGAGHRLSQVGALALDSERQLGAAQAPQQRVRGDPTAVAERPQAERGISSQARVEASHAAQGSAVDRVELDANGAGQEAHLHAVHGAQGVRQDVDHGPLRLVAHLVVARAAEPQLDGVLGHPELEADARPEPSVDQAAALQPDPPGALVLTQANVRQVQELLGFARAGGQVHRAASPWATRSQDGQNPRKLMSLSGTARLPQSSHAAHLRVVGAAASSTWNTCTLIEPTRLVMTATGRVSQGDVPAVGPAAELHAAAEERVPGRVGVVDAVEGVADGQVAEEDDGGVLFTVSTPDSWVVPLERRGREDRLRCAHYTEEFKVLS